MANDAFFKSYSAGGAVSKYRICKPGTNPGEVVVAAGPTDKLLGPTDNLDVAQGQPIDVCHDGIAFVVYGGTVAFGDMLTSDANGAAVTAAPATGVNNRVVGIALEAGVAGDVRPMLVGLGTIQG